MVRVFALAALAAAAACAGTKARSSPPAAAVEAYADALEADDPRAAYALLSERAREATSYAAFERAWREAARERARAAQRLRERLAQEPEVGARAAVLLADGETVHLRREGDEWVLRDPLATPGRAPTPRDAIAKLAAAVEQARASGLLGVLTERRRGPLEERLDGLAAGLAAHRDAPIERIADDRAALEWSDDSTRYRIVLLLEEDEWRVDEVHLSGITD